jgi:hypothetical protein
VEGESMSVSCLCVKLQTGWSVSPILPSGPCNSLKPGNVNVREIAI